MEHAQDFYALLGVSRNASADDIKRAYAKKRREYQDDEEKSTQLNQAYAVLCDPAQRSQYDVERQFGNQIEDILEKIRNCEDSEQKIKYMTELKGVYLNILKADTGNVKALSELADIEKLLGNEEQAIEYLKRLEKCVDGADKLQVYHKLGELYQKLKKTDDAIKCFYVIYKADVTYEDDILALVRLFYEEKKNIKAAIQILNDCINKSTDERYKIIYLYEAIRAVRVSKNASYQKLEETLYARLEKFRTEDADNSQKKDAALLVCGGDAELAARMLEKLRPEEDTESNLKNAAVLVLCLGDAVDRDDFECFHRLEKMYQAYNIKNPELNEAFEALQQLTKLAETGKVHKAIELCLEEEWTKEIREQFGRLLIKEAAEIKQSLECIKKEAPKYWNCEKEKLSELEKVVEENLKASKEFNALSRDRSISASVVTMAECVLLFNWVEYEDVKERFENAYDSFFKEDREKMQRTLRKMEEFYPMCYQKIAEIFFEGKSTQELFGDAPISSPQELFGAEPISSQQNNNIRRIIKEERRKAEKEQKQTEAVSREPAKETESDKCCNRGRDLSEQGKYAEAEQEYLNAVKLSGDDDAYAEKLIAFYYSTMQKDFERKADKLYRAWWRRQRWNQFGLHTLRCCLCFYVVAAGFGGVGILGLLASVYLSLCFGAKGQKTLAVRKYRAKSGKEKVLAEIGFVMTRLVIPCLIVVAGMYFLKDYLALALERLPQWVSWGTVNNLIGDTASPDMMKPLEWLRQFDLWGIINTVIGAGGVLGLLVSFNKVVSVFQNGVSQWKDGRGKSFGTVFKGVRAAGIVIIFGAAYAMYKGIWMPW